MTVYEFGKLKVQVDYGQSVREREESTVGHTLYRVTLKVPGRKSLVRTTWKSNSLFDTETRGIRDVATEFMYALVQAWAKPREYLHSEVSNAQKYAGGDLEEVEEKRNLATELIRYAAEIDPFMESAVDSLWQLTRRDDQKRARGPREWFPPRTT
jgi:hypothetical protein